MIISNHVPAILRQPDATMGCMLTTIIDVSGLPLVIHHMVALLNILSLIITKSVEICITNATRLQ